MESPDHLMVNGHVPQQLEVVFQEPITSAKGNMGAISLRRQLRIASIERHGDEDGESQWVCTMQVGYSAQPQALAEKLSELGLGAAVREIKN